MAVEIVGGAIGLVSTIAIGIFAFLRMRAQHEERGEKRLWKRVEKLEERLDDCDRRHNECAEELGATRLVMFRNIGVGEDTGKFLIEEARTSIASKRPPPPPPVKR